MSMREILCHIYGLLMCPDMDTPIDGYDEYCKIIVMMKLKSKPLWLNLNKIGD